MLLSDIHHFQPPMQVSIEQWDREREYWESKDQNGLDEKKVAQNLEFAFCDMSM